MITSVVARGAETASNFSVTSSLNTIKEIATWVLAFVMENPVLALFFAGGLIFVGIRVVKAIIRAIKK